MINIYFNTPIGIILLESIFVILLNLVVGIKISMTNLELLLYRHSSPFLAKPSPNEEELEMILNAAMCVPDHGGLTPWHFTVIKDDGLLHLSKIFTDAAVSDNEEQVKLDKVAKMPFRAPLIIMVSTKYKAHIKVPEKEQLIAAGCSIYAMQLAAFSLGYGSMWRTGALSYHKLVKENLNVGDHDDIVGFLYVGTTVKNTNSKSKKSFKAHVSYL